MTNGLCDVKDKVTGEAVGALRLRSARLRRRKPFPQKNPNFNGRHHSIPQIIRIATPIRKTANTRLMIATGSR